MSWLTPPPRLEKPIAPGLAALPAPKRKGVASVVIVVPSVIGLGAGCLLAWGMTWLATTSPSKISPLLVHPLVRFGVIIWLTLMGAVVGLRTLMEVLSTVGKESNVSTDGTEK